MTDGDVVLLLLPTGVALLETYLAAVPANAVAACVNVLGGAVPPLLAAALQSTYGSTAIGIFLSALGLLGLLCTLALRETTTAGSLAEREPAVSP